MTTSDPLLMPAEPLATTELAKIHPTILLVEDDRALRRYIEVILQRAGYNVITAADGLEAMKATLSSTIHAVVTDAMMPHLSGYELCRFLKHHPKLSHIPVVLLSGLNGGSTPPEAGDCADAYLTKPVRAQELTDCLARLLPKTG